MPSSSVRLCLLLAVLVVIYGPSTSGGFLGYDDNWMIEENAFYKSAQLSKLLPIWFDLSKDTRLLLGAEYLPLRDSTVLFDVLLFGLSPNAMRLQNLAWYLVAAYGCIRTWRAALGPHSSSDFLAAFFLLHPAHAESVAWIIGRKDVMGLTFFWFGMWMHVGNNPKLRWVAWVCLGFAQLSKFLFIAAAPLLLCMDVLRDKRPPWRSAVVTYAVPSLICLGIALVQFSVAKDTTMVEDLAQPYATRLATMGTVWLGYLLSAFSGLGLNVMHETRITSGISWQGLLGYGAIGGWLSIALHRFFRRHDAKPLARAAWFFLPLVPVSHLLIPVQNFHEDRYLLLSVMGAGLCYHGLWTSPRVVGSSPPRATLAHYLAWGVVAVFALMSAHRAYLFTDPIRLFSQATNSTHFSSKAPYQLGLAHEQRNQDQRALVAYHQAVARSEDEFARRATNNLARLYARHGNYAQAELYLRRGVRLWPNEPKLLSNLAEVLWLSGRREQARALYEQLIMRFPDHQRSREKYQQHFGHQP